MSRGSMLQSKASRLTRFVLAIVIVIGGHCLCQCSSLALELPTDRELAALFRSHRDAFERLRTMAMEDTGVIGYISKDTLWAKTLSGRRNTLSDARRSEYMRLLSEIRPDLVIRIDFRQISFSYWSGGVGLAIARSWMKGIAYLPYGYTRVGEIVDGLDKLPEHDGVYLVPIEGNWYIVYLKLD